MRSGAQCDRAARAGSAFGKDEMGAQPHSNPRDRWHPLSRSYALTLAMKCSTEIQKTVAVLQYDRRACSGGRIQGELNGCSAKGVKREEKGEQRAKAGEQNRNRTRVHVGCESRCKSESEKR